MAAKVAKKKPAARSGGKPAVGARSLDAEVARTLSNLKRLGTKKTRDEMGPRYGIVAEKAFGVTMAAMKAEAKRLGTDHDLAGALWATGWYEARMVATMIDDPASVGTAQMDRWRRDFDNWGICDTACFVLFDRTAHALGRVDKWSALRDEFGRRAAFALLACVALHRKDIADQEFLVRLPLIERAATDDRNFVRKAVSWALRAIGRRNRALHSAAVEVADRLAASKDPSARWVGKDALRDLRRPAARSSAAAKRKSAD